MPPPPTFKISPAIPAHFSAPLTSPPPKTIHLASGLVFSQQGQSSSTSPLRVLLLKRAPSERFPLDNNWDFPGGGIEFGPASSASSYDPSTGSEADKSIIHAAVREVHEETGLSVTNVAAYIGADSWITGSASSDDGTKTVMKFCFLVDVQEFENTVTGAEWETIEVKLMEEEHTEFVWAKEEEVEGFTFISREQTEMVLKGFQKWRELRGFST